MNFLRISDSWRCHLKKVYTRTATVRWKAPEVLAALAPDAQDGAVSDPGQLECRTMTCGTQRIEATWRALQRYGGCDQRGGTGHTTAEGFEAAITVNVRVGQFHIVNRHADPWKAYGAACKDMMLA